MPTLPPLHLDFSKNDFLSLPLSVIQSAVMPVVVRRPDGGLVGLGTAFTIAPGLMLTASHVMQEAVEGQGALVEGAMAGVVCLASSDEAASEFFGALLPIERSRHYQSFDIALLEVGVPFIDDEPVPLLQLPLTAELPTVGDQVIALGYSRLDASHRQHGEVESAYQLQQDFNGTRGRVEEVHPVRRDWFLPFPCFRTNARFDGGISGGPVFNAEGFVCGVVCSGYELGEEEVGYTSYASILFPAFFFESLRTEEGEVRMYSLLEFVKVGAIQGHESLSRLELTTDASGERRITLRN
jgi:hypothetical protein